MSSAQSALTCPQSTSLRQPRRDSRPVMPPVCTADELHYAPVSGAGWRLELWRYKPPPHAPARNHPLMLLSGVGTNAIGFDLYPGGEGCTVHTSIYSNGDEVLILDCN